MKRADRERIQAQHNRTVMQHEIRVAYQNSATAKGAVARTKIAKRLDKLLAGLDVPQTGVLR